MTELFIKLLNMSLTAGWLVLAVCLFRLVFKNAPKFLRCVLWAMVALRLVLPFSLESVFSLVPKTPSVTAGFEQLNPFIPAENFVNNASPFISDNPGVFAPSDAAPGVQPVLIISYVWLAGVILMLLYSLFSFIKIKRGVLYAVKLQKNIYECSAATPFVLGLFRPKIYLPFGMDETERAFVIAHEQGHIKRGDHWYKPIGFMLLSVYWFNPLMWIAFVLLCRDIELACDEKVIKQFGNEEKKDYSKALLSLSVSRKSISACPVAFGETSVKHRVKSVLSYKKPAFWIIIVAVTVCAVITVCFLTDPKEKTPDYNYSDPLAFYDSIEFDIDGDGKKENCSLGMGTTSGLFTFTFYATKENSDEFYLNIFLSDWGKLSFDKSAFGNKLFVKLDGAENGGEVQLYDVSVKDGDIVLSYSDGELKNLIPGGSYAKAFLEGAFVEENENGFVPANDSSWGITLKADNVTPTGMTLALKQVGGELGKGVFITEQRYEIEVFLNGEWKSLGNSGYFTTEAIMILPGGEYEWKIDWSHSYGQLEASSSAGLYRISKNVWFSKDSSMNSEQTKTFYAFFEVPSNSPDAEPMSFELVNKNPQKGDCGFLSQSAIDSILNLDYVDGSYKEGAPNAYKIAFYNRNKVVFSSALASNDYPVLTVDDEQTFLNGNGKGIEITYCVGANQINWGITTDNVAIIPKSLYDRCRITVADIFRFCCDVYCELKSGYSCILNFSIIGYYEGDINGETPILIPTSSFTARMKARAVDPIEEMAYSSAGFTIDPAMNYSVEKVREDIMRILAEDNAGNSEIEVVFKEKV